MAKTKVTYKEPASYFTKEMLETAKKWDREHKKTDTAQAAKENNKKNK